MTKYLVIVESPAKSKTIKKYLGKDYEVLASYGHVRDLIPKEGAVDTEHDFAMKYQMIEKNARHVDTIKKSLSKVDELLLATDPDREGEAISWHIYELLKNTKALKGKPTKRVVFNEITKTAVQHAVNNPRELSQDLIDAQQARRALDYLVGFNLSPLLWKKVRRGLSAGRVQSPALRLIVERELDIEKFVSQEYWSVTADLLKDKQAFQAKLAEYQGKKLEQFSITNAEQAAEVEDTLNKAANGQLLVSKIEKKQRKRHPAAPFITSTLQQEASRKLGFGAQQTMRLAQQLYEGVDVGDGAVGLITYMRTDSVNLSVEAVEQMRDVIKERYGEDNLPDNIPVYKTKAKNAQEAHEAIRPTHPELFPENIKHALDAKQFKLYDLIWKRAIACQMKHATLNLVSVDLTCGEGNRFRASGSTIAHPGFMAVYLEGVDDNQVSDGQEKLLPAMEEGEMITLVAIKPNQHFTEPPPRYSEATLVKALEEFGIGRPSTYAAIISTLQARDYALLEQKRFHPTDVGRIVNKFLTTYFPRYVDYNFTAKLEDELDDVARGDKQWVPLLKTFWKPFNKLVHEIDETVQRKDVTQEPIDEKCPKCGGQLAIRLGRAGRFVGCNAYPDCDYTRNLDGSNAGTEPEIVPDRKCPECQNDLVFKVGKYGKFIGCSNYPNCKHIEPLEKPTDTGVQCPSCKKANILQRKSRKGKIFYSCGRYPDCKYALWNEPVAESCPQCKWPILSIKVTKRSGTEKLCPQADCDYKVQVEEN